MCAVSAIGDFYTRRINEDDRWKYYTNPCTAGGVDTTFPAVKVKLVDSTPPSREEFDALKKELEEMKEILKVAKKYDEDTNQHHCEQEEKVELLKKLFDIFGVTHEDVFPKE